RALLFFIAIACIGYVVYFTGKSWPLIFVGLAFSMAWHSMASPVIFAVIGDSLPKERRAMGFTFQSMLKRLPMIVAPLIGGAMIARYGIATGLRAGFVITLGLAAISALIVMTIRI